jgi:hypothetical protein
MQMAGQQNPGIDGKGMARLHRFDSITQCRTDRIITMNQAAAISDHRKKLSYARNIRALIT